MRRLIGLALIIVAFAVASAPVPAVTQDKAHQLAKAAGTPTASAKTCGSVATMEDCHARFPAGCSNSPRGYDGYLDFLKNQRPAPDTAPTRFLTKQDFIDLEAKRPPGLSTSNHADNAPALADLGEGNIVGVVGFLYAVKPGGIETCNCGLADERTHHAVDYHIWIGFDQSDAQRAAGLRAADPQLHTLKETAVVVEMTPHYRAEHHPTWAINQVQGVLGRQVKVIGQLLVDNDHITKKDDCGVAGANTTSCWRLTVWEVHPVIQFFVCDGDAPCEQKSNHWKSLDQP